MLRFSTVLVVTGLGAATLTMAGAGCSSSPTSPSPETVDVPSGTHQSPLIAVAGTGAGGVSVTPVSVQSQTFEALIKVRVQRARANTTYIVQRSPEIGRALGADGACQRAFGQPPWSATDPPAAAFVTFPNGAVPYTVQTDGSGNGSLDFEFRAATIPAGTLFDVMFRLVDSETAATLDLRSGCFTVTVK